MEDRLPVVQDVEGRLRAAVVRCFSGSRLERELLSRAFELVCPPPRRGSDATLGQVMKSNAVFPASAPLRKGA